MKTGFEHQVISKYDESHIRNYIQQNWNSLWKDIPERKEWFAQEYTDITLLYNLPDSLTEVFGKFHINEKLINDMCLQSLFSKLTRETGRRLGRAMLIKLPAKKSISSHIDRGHHLEKCDRIHLPIITDSNVKFTINKNIYDMPAGVIARINNNLWHSVENSSENDRVHLVMDFVEKDDDYYNIDRKELDRFLIQH
jgi:hypothetical protein